MTKTREERLAYARGYNRIRAQHWRQVMKLLDIARGFREAAGAPNRRCDGCIHWRREDALQWGRCDKDFEWFVDAQIQCDGPLVTAENFACTNWRAA